MNRFITICNGLQMVCLSVCIEDASAVADSGTEDCYSSYGRQILVQQCDGICDKDSFKKVCASMCGAIRIN